MLVSERLFRFFHREWQAIDRLWPHFTDAPDDVKALREWARNELRAEVRRSCELGEQGSFLVPV